MEWILSLPAMMAVGVAMLLMGLSHLRRNPYRSRLDLLLAEEEPLGADVRRESDQPALSPLRRLVRAVGARVCCLLRVRNRSEFEQSIGLAGLGLDWGVNDLMGLRVVAAVLGGVLGFLGTVWFFSWDIALLASLVLAVAGLASPWMWLHDRVEARQRTIVRDLPEAIDLLSLCLDAGLNFDGAMKAAVSRWKGPLMQEFAVVLREIELGRSRRESLRRMAERTRIEEVGAFVAAVVQAEQLGTGMQQTIKMQSFDARLAYIRRVREAAMRAPVKMIVPMAFFVLPAMFIVIMGPAVPQLARSMLGGQ